MRTTILCLVGLHIHITLYISTKMLQIQILMNLKTNIFVCLISSPEYNQFSAQFILFSENLFQIFMSYKLVYDWIKVACFITHNCLKCRNLLDFSQINYLYNHLLFVDLISNSKINTGIMIAVWRDLIFILFRINIYVFYKHWEIIKLYFCRILNIYTFAIWSILHQNISVPCRSCSNQNGVSLMTNKVCHTKKV